MDRPLRFVVLRHTGYGEPHFDLMLETDVSGPLLTWRCPDWPIVDSSVCQPLAAHRRAYLTYEGPVSNGRGFVKQVLTGTYDKVRSSESHIEVVIDGQTISLHLA